MDASFSSLYAINHGDFKSGQTSNLIKRNDFILLPKDEQSWSLQFIPVLSFTDDPCTANRIVIDWKYNHISFAETHWHTIDGHSGFDLGIFQCQVMCGNPSSAETNSPNVFGPTLLLQEPQHSIYFPEDGHAWKVSHRRMKTTFFVCMQSNLSVLKLIKRCMWTLAFTTIHKQHFYYLLMSVGFLSSSQSWNLDQSLPGVHGSFPT